MRMLAFIPTLALISCTNANLAPCEDRQAAYDAANMLVSESLKAPATASFPSIDAKGVIAMWEQNPRGKCGFWVSGYVDAQNSFGANIRESYMVHTYHKGKGDWQLEKPPLFLSELNR